MDMSELSTFVWGALSGGAFYDVVKGSLGISYKKLSNYVKANNQVDFDNELKIILEKNMQLGFLLEGLIKEVKSNTTNKNVNYGSVLAGGSVHLGDNILK